MRYWVDDFGRLWKGPCSRDNTLHYATFHGYMKREPYDPIWVLERSEEPQDAEEITTENARVIMLMFVTAGTS